MFSETPSGSRRVCLEKYQVEAEEYVERNTKLKQKSMFSETPS
jgi:hypothetical protein